MDNQAWRILLVDDDEDDYVVMRDLVREIQAWRANLEWAKSFDAGLAKIKTEAHDVYLFDYRLGEKNGLDLLKEALTAGCQAPIIILTGQGDYELDKQAMELGAVDYLTKGKIDAPTLERSVRYGVQRKRVEKALEASRRSQQMILDAAGEGIAGIDKDGRVTFINPTGAKLLGWNPEELIGKSAHELWHHSRPDKTPFPVDACPNLMVLKDGATRMAPRELYWRKDGTPIDVDHTTTATLENGQVIGAVIVFRDMTERRRMEAALMKSEKMAGIGQFAAGVAHDVNNPIAVILGFSQILLGDCAQNERMLMPLQSIEREALRCKTLVQNLLSFSRGTLDKTSLRLQDLNTVMEGALVLVGTLARSRQIQLISPAKQDLPYVPVDSGQIQQVIINLCTNAIDAMSQGGKLTVGLSSKGDHVEISVQDVGTGISPEIREKIFDAFFTTKEAGKGTGLGLSIISRIVQAHQGKIELQSEVGKGSTFTIHLPVTHSDSSIQPIKKAA